VVLTFAMLLLSHPMGLRADVRLQILETDPASPATLQRDENLYIRIGYDTDRPIRIRGQAYYAGQQVTSMTSGSPPYRAGSGEAMFWFAWREPAQVDRIIITAEDERSGKVIAQTDTFVSFTWTAHAPITTRPRAEWVTRMTEEQNRRSRAAAEAYANRPGRWLEDVFGLAIIWCVPAYIVVQIVALVRLRERWRFAASLPLIPMALVLAYTVYAYRAGSNIFPLVLIFTSPFGLAYLAILMLLHRRRQQLA
jgi:hypothetical protein